MFAEPVRAKKSSSRSGPPTAQREDRQSHGSQRLEGAERTAPAIPGALWESLAVSPTPPAASPPALPKLMVGAAHDPVEHEADRVADAIGTEERIELGQQRAPAGVVHRKCTSCAPEAAEQPKPACASCAAAAAEQPALRRKASAAQPQPGVAPEPVSARIQARRGAGAPLDRDSRSYFERRLGQDFSDVRVHSDLEAGGLARAVHADAFTVGSELYFAPGRLDSRSREGRRLLAHELTHVVQARGAAPTLRRQESTTVTIEQPTGPTACSSTEHDPAIRSGFQLAVQWLNTSLTNLNLHIRNATGLPMAGPNGVPWPNFVVSLPTRAPEALQRHFRSTSVETATRVRDNLSQIRTDLSSRADLQVECHQSDEGNCHGSGAAVIGSRVVLCPGYFSAGDTWRATALIHEFAHALTGGPHIGDRGYQSERAYVLLSAAEALRNAESYALLAQELGTRQAVVSTAPRDTTTDCPDAWQPLIRAAIGRGERWNRNAQVALADIRPDWIAGISPTVTTAFGSATPAVRSAALATYDRVLGELSSDVSFECETDATAGRCATAQTYWYFVDRLHLCPSWRNLPTESARIHAMMVGIYGWKGGEGDGARRQQLATFARDITPIFEPSA
jgi:hypothetical protein